LLPLQHIDLLPLQSQLKHKNDARGLPTVFDPVRRKYVRTNPEKIVRQLWLVYFLEVIQLNPKLIAVERKFVAHGTARRFDLVVFDTNSKPMLLAEFKAPDIALQQTVFDQIAHYNMQLKVPHALVSNGRTHYCFRIDDGQQEFVWETELPFQK
jgi:hypothetical protein